jgi:hypothetical protein
MKTHILLWAVFFISGICSQVCNEFGQCGLGGNSNGIGCNYATAPGTCGCACNQIDSNSVDAVCVANPFPGISCQNIGNTCPSPPPECYDVRCNLFDDCCEYYYIPGCQITGASITPSPSPSATPAPTFSGQCQNSPPCVTYRYSDPVFPVGFTGIGEPLTYVTMGLGGNLLFVDPDPILIQDCNAQFTETCNCACVPWDYALIGPDATNFGNGTCGANAKPGIPVTYILIENQLQPVCPQFECFRNLFGVKWFLQGSVYGNPTCCEYATIPDCVIIQTQSATPTPSISPSESASASISPSAPATPSPSQTVAVIPSSGTTTVTGGATGTGTGTGSGGSGVNVAIKVNVGNKHHESDDNDDDDGFEWVWIFVVAGVLMCLAALFAIAMSGSRGARLHAN